jgi:hypothetical protein
LSFWSAVCHTACVGLLPAAVDVVDVDEGEVDMVDVEGVDAEVVVVDVVVVEGVRSEVVDGAALGVGVVVEVDATDVAPAGLT